jgi:uncharacterized protein
MQYVIIGLDGTDEQALDRRLKVRPDHLDLGAKMVEDGRMLYGAALKKEDGTMKGSLLVMNFATKEKLDEWLEIEPYVTGNVWENITIHQSNTNMPWQFNRTQEWFENNL